MTDRVTRADLEQTAPDPLVDFEGFLDAVVAQVVATHEELDRQPPRRRAEIRLLRAIDRMLTGLSDDHPQAALDLYARGLHRALGNWSAANEADP